MSLSNQQLRHVVGEGEDQSTVSWTAQRLRNLIPVIQRSLGQSLMAGEEAVELQEMIDGGNALDSAADILDRLCEYLGTLEV